MVLQMQNVIVCGHKNIQFKKRLSRLYPLLPGTFKIVLIKQIGRGPMPASSDVVICSFLQIVSFPCITYPVTKVTDLVV